jgi:glycosyltransferase involved in cell wall biosynthesis
MRILHILDHSPPLQSGYVFRTLAIVNQQRALGWDPMLLTSGKHYAPGPARERIGEWEFLRTPMPNGFAARVPWLRELKIVSDLGRRIEDILEEVQPEILHAHSPVLNALPTIRAGRRHGVPVVYEVRSLWEDAATVNGTSSAAGLRYRASQFLETHALRRADAVTTICQGLRDEVAARGIPSEKITIIPNAVDRPFPSCSRETRKSRFFWSAEVRKKPFCGPWLEILVSGKASSLPGGSRTRRSNPTTIWRTFWYSRGSRCA